jgi:hypothetical protein
MGKLPLTELMAASKPNVPIITKVPLCIDEDNNTIKQVSITTILQYSAEHSS